MRVEGISPTSSVKNIQLIEKQLANNQVKKEFEDMSGETKDLNQGKITEEELITTIEKASKNFEIYDKRLEFSIHEKTKEIMVKIVDTKTEEVIKEIPPEKILDMVAKLMELAGILVDEKV